MSTEGRCQVVVVAFYEQNYERRKEISNDVSCKIVRYVPYIFCCSVGITILIIKFSFHLFPVPVVKVQMDFFSIVPGYLQDIIYFFNSVFSVTKKVPYNHS